MEAHKELFRRSIATNRSELRNICWNGIPDVYRAEAWQILIGYLPSDGAKRTETLKQKRKEYSSLLSNTCWDPSVKSEEGTPVLGQVQKDIPRTAPDLPLFRNKRVQSRLERMLYVWAWRHPATSYVQGMNDIVVPFFIVFLKSHCKEGEISFSDENLDHVEADCYWCLSKIMSSIQDHYIPGQLGIHKMISHLEDLISHVNYELYQHITKNGIEVIHFAFRWMNCLLVRELPHRCVLRLFDTYLSEEDGFNDFHVYVCAAFLNSFSSKLIKLEHDGILEFLTHIPAEEISQSGVELMLSQAHVWRELYKGSGAHLMCSRQIQRKKISNAPDKTSKRFYVSNPMVDAMFSSSVQLYKEFMQPQKVQDSDDSSAVTFNEQEIFTRASLMADVDFLCYS